MTASQAPGYTDRKSLEVLMDSYLKALVVHDPTQLPLSNAVKHTENTIVIPLGSGLWGTASDFPSYRLYICDPRAGQVGLFGLMKENDFPIIVSIRLKIEKGLITEIESIVVRSGERPIPTHNLVKPKPIYLETLTPPERVSREEMVRISDLYFQALEQDDGDIVPWY